MNIVAVNVAFRDELFYKRWRLLANDYNLNVTLIGPKYSEYKHAGPTIKFVPDPVDEGNFKVKHVDMRRKKYLLFSWFSWEYFRILKEMKPDFVYLIGYEIDLVVLKTSIYKWLFAPSMKIALFTMRGTDITFNNRVFKFKWTINKRLFDFINVHYPHGKEIMRGKGGFKGSRPHSAW